MTSFFPNATWIEDAFVDAASFHPDSSAHAGSRLDDENDDGGDISRSSDSRRIKLEPDAGGASSSASARPSSSAATSGGVGTGAVADAGPGGGSSAGTRAAEAPPRHGRIARVVRRGGDFSSRGRRRRHDDEDPSVGSSSSSCPPYLVVHDGWHSAVAFLSPEALAGILPPVDGDCDDGARHPDADVVPPPPNGSLVRMFDYTISTVLQCTSADYAAHRCDYVSGNAALLNLSGKNRTSRHRIGDQLLMCLYLQKPISLVDATANRGSTGDSVDDVHRSASLTKVLINHQRKYPDSIDAGGIVEEGETHSHSILIRRLEARHCFRLLMAGDKRGLPWPWASRLNAPIDGAGHTARAIKEEDDENDGRCLECISRAAVADGAASGDNVEVTAASSPSSDESEDKGEGKLDIVELVDALPDLRNRPSVADYTDADFELMDWIRENTDWLISLKEKLSRSYRSNADDAPSIKRRSIITPSSSPENTATTPEAASSAGQTAGKDADGRKDGGRGGRKEGASKRRRAEREKEAEASLARNRPRRSLATAGGERVGGGSGGDDGGTGGKTATSDTNGKRPQQKRERYRPFRRKGCANYARSGGVCARHGAPYKPCGRGGCANNVQKGGVCIRHGANVVPRRTCGEDGCANHVVHGGLCIRHGVKVFAGKTCVREGCANYARRGGVCQRHGAMRICGHGGCAYFARTGGMCQRHGG